MCAIGGPPPTYVAACWTSWFRLARPRPGDLATGPQAGEPQRNNGPSGVIGPTSPAQPDGFRREPGYRFALACPAPGGLPVFLVSTQRLSVRHGAGLGPERASPAGAARVQASIGGRARLCKPDQLRRRPARAPAVGADAAQSEPLRRRQTRDLSGPTPRQTPIRSDVRRELLHATRRESQFRPTFGIFRSRLPRLNNATDRS